jgi:magnesium chelatase subunit D
VLGQRWLAALALDPQGLGGLLLRARASPLRDAWLASALPLLSAYGVGPVGGPRPVRKLPHNTPDERLLGGLDVAASIAAGRAITQAGLLAEVDGGVLVAPMAERMTEATAAKLAAALDTGTLTLARDGLHGQLPARFALLALDEGIDDEAAPPALAERLAFRLNLDALLAERLQDSPQDHAEGHVPQAPEIPIAQPTPLPLAQVQVPDALMQAICAAALALSVGSMRPCLQAVRAARAFAALDGCAEATEAHAREAVEAVLAHRATRLPAPPPEEDGQDPPPPPNDPQANQNPDEQGQPPKPEDAKPLEDQLIEAAQAAIPADLLALLGTPTSRGSGRSGKAGALHRSNTRGRPVGTMATSLKRPPRLNVLATLRSAVPWQKLRTATAHGGIKVERSDFRVTRFAERATTLTVFAVDASGSAALHRLAEAKGAVETLLADCYVRRDEVAVVGFRGHKAELLLPPTRSLVRAKRALSGLPGGGGTPLASGLEASFHVLAAATKRQQTPTLVVLTDGRANIGRNGQPGREQAHQDALLMARHLRAMGARSLLVDTAPQPSPVAREVAAAMGAQYLALPHAQAKLVARAAAELGR